MCMQNIRNTRYHTFSNFIKMILNPLVSEMAQLTLSRPMRFDVTHFYLHAAGCTWSSCSKELLLIHAGNEPFCQIWVTCLALCLNIWKHLLKYSLHPPLMVVSLSPNEWAKYGCSCHVLFQWKQSGLTQKEYSCLCTWSGVLGNWRKESHWIISLRLCTMCWETE